MIRMNKFQDEIQRRGITRLCHFTKSSNLPFILGDGKFEKNGILSTDYIRQSDYLEELDKQRLDGHTNYVSCSIQRPNSKYMRFREEHSKDDLFNQWVVLCIDPSVIDDTSLFSPVNAATASGKNVKSGFGAFENMFADPISFVRYNKLQEEDRASDLPLNLTTDSQAEVLIKDRIPKDKITDIVFPADTYEVEKLRLSFCIGDLKDLGINIKRMEVNNGY